MTSWCFLSQIQETVSQSQIRSTPHNTCQPISMKQYCDIRTICMFCDIPKMLVFTVRERCVLFFKISMALEYEMFSKFCPLISMIWGQTRHNVFMLKYLYGKCCSVQSNLYLISTLEPSFCRFTGLLHSLDEDAEAPLAAALKREEQRRLSGRLLQGDLTTLGFSSTRDVQQTQMTLHFLRHNSIEFDKTTPMYSWSNTYVHNL